MTANALLCSVIECVLHRTTLFDQIPSTALHSTGLLLHFVAPGSFLHRLLLYRRTLMMAYCKDGRAAVGRYDAIHNIGAAPQSCPASTYTIIQIYNYTITQIHTHSNTQIQIHNIEAAPQSCAGEA